MASEFDTQLAQAGGRRRQAAAPDPVTLGWLQEECAKLERILRLQDADGQLAEADEQELATYPATTTTGALKRWSFLKHLFRRLAEADTPTAAAASPLDAAFQLLSREPVVVQLAGRTVEVTGRSYSALHHIAAHYQRIRVLDLDRQAAADLLARLQEAGPRHRRRAERVRRILERIWTEQAAQRQMLYAHALTPDGAPAKSVEAAPDWWDEVTPTDDAALLLAVFEAGPGRANRLGKPPAARGSGRKHQPAEDWGWLSVLTAWGIRTHVPPAAMLDRDLGQVVAESRTAPAPTLEEEVESLA